MVVALKLPALCIVVSPLAPSELLKIVSGGVTLEYEIDIPVGAMNVPKSDVIARLAGGCDATSEAELAPAVPERVFTFVPTLANVAVRKLVPAPPGKLVISTVPWNAWASRPNMVTAAPELATPT